MYFQYFAEHRNWTRDQVLKMSLRDLRLYSTDVGKFLTGTAGQKITSTSKDEIFAIQTQNARKRELITNTIKARLLG